MGSFTHRTLYPGERARGTHWTGGWIDPRVVAVARKKFSGRGKDVPVLD